MASAFPAELAGVPAAMVMRDMVARGQIPDSHRCLRLLSKLGTGLGALTAEGVAQAASRMFAALGWLESLCRDGADMDLGRACCSMVSVFHRRGFTDLALQALHWLRQRSLELPVCTVALTIDLCLQDGRHQEAKELFKETQVLLTRMLAAPPETMRGHYAESVSTAAVEPKDFDEDENHEDDDSSLTRSNSGANNSPSLSAKPAPGDWPVDRSTLCTDGLPSWLSSREGHLMALIAGHVVVLNRLLPLDAGHWKDQGEVRSREALCPDFDGALHWARDVLDHGFELLESLSKEATADSSSRFAFVGPLESFSQRLRSAQLHLIAPVARATLWQTDPHVTLDELEKLVTSRGFDTLQVAKSGLKEVGRPQAEKPKVRLELPPSSNEDAADAMQTLLNLAVKLNGQRRPCREDIDDILRTMGRRKGRRPGLVLEAFRLASELATRGLEVLQATTEEDQQFLDKARSQKREEEEVAQAANKLFFQQLSPDTESCAAAIEALFACGAAQAAEDMLLRCQAVFLPNPALYSAVIFGRLYSGDGQGAVDAILDMDKAGFTPHQRFILRCLRYMGSFHKEGLLLVDRLAFPTMQQKMLHVLMETCISAPEPAACVLDVYQSLLEKGYPPTPETHFALLKALCGISSADLAIEELRKLQAKHILPEHVGFEILLCDCYGLSASSRRAGQVIEARRLWVLEVSAALMAEPSDHLATIFRDLRSRHEAECQPHPEEQAGVSGDADVHEPPVLTELEDADEEDDAAEGVTRPASDDAVDQDPMAPCWFGPRYKYSWVLSGYCAAMPLQLAAVNASHYLVFRYGLVRSGMQKAALQQELDACMLRDHAGLASELHERLQLEDSIVMQHRAGSGCDGMEEGCWEPMAFILLILMQLDNLEVVEGTQVRLLRMFFRSLPASARCLSEAHAAFLRKEAGQLSPGVLTELIRACEDCAGGAASPFSIEQGRQMLAETVRDNYLKRPPGGEPIKLSTCLRFVRMHDLADRIADEVLLTPVLYSMHDGQPQHAYNLGEGDVRLQLRLVSFAICKGKRLAAGRLIERFGLLDLGLEDLELPCWSEAQGRFRDVCQACVREAEEAEERELRAASDRKMAAAAEEDACCLQLPEAVAANVFLVSTEAELQEIRVRLQSVVESAPADGPDAGTLLGRRGAAIGLDTEWKPFLEKRGGMQKHRRSSQSVVSMEPCSTLQVAAEDFVVVFDLLALAPADRGTAQTLSAILTSLFNHRGIVKLGFGLQNDLQRLAASYPHLDCFKQIYGTLDLQEALMEARRNKGQTTGLSSLCLEFLGSPLSKRLQTSDWGARPLRPEQLSYAALDAHCLLTLARTLHSHDREPAIKAAMRLQDLKVHSVAQKMVVSVAGVALPAATVDAEAVAKASQDIALKGSEIRAMKAAGKAKSAWQAEVAVLLQLKARFRELAGVDWVPPVSPAVS